jgi:aquaporin Z
MKYSPASKYFVEYVGTLLLSFSIFYTGNYLLIGVTLALIVLLGGSISGGAFNPSISAALYYANKLSLTDFVIYSLVQVLGALSGWYISKQILGQ